MPVTITAFPSGPLETNAYLVADPHTGEALVIDAPPGVTATILAAVGDAGLRVSRVVITHGHWDHIGDAATLKEATGAPLVGHPGLAERLAQPPDTAPMPIPPAALDATIDEGDTVELGGTTFAVMYLPGHDPAHIVLYSESERVLLGGDVLFPGGHGRTDIPGSDQATMDRSLARLAPLPDDVTVHPGHGDPTTIGAERHWMPKGERQASSGKL